MHLKLKIDILSNILYIMRSLNIVKRMAFYNVFRECRTELFRDVVVEKAYLKVKD